MEYSTVRMQQLIKEIHLLSKPKHSIIFSRKFHSILSYALLMSNFKIINPNLPFLLFLWWCKVSKAIRMLSEIRRLDMKALWVSDTSLGMIFLRWFAIVLEIILYMTLQRLMGRKSLGLAGDFILGMREIKVWFMLKDFEILPIIIFYLLSCKILNFV